MLRLGVVPIANGGTGSATQNFVDLTNAQTIGGGKTFSSTTRVSNGTSGAAAAGTADLVVEDNLAAFQHFLTPNDVESGILFGDVTDSIAGGIIFNNAATNNGIQFRTGGNVTRMTLDGSGNLGITGNGTVGGDLAVGGTLTLNIVNATTQYNIGGSRLLSVAGTANTFTGISAGAGNAAGSNNSFFGNQAGQSNVSGSSNSFFGRSAGLLSTGSSNSFFGTTAGDANTSGGSNAFFGLSAGGANTTGSSNVFLGREAGFFNTTGGNNTAIGTGAGPAVGFSNLAFATAIGAGATVADSNSIVLGRSAGEDIVRIPGTTVIAGNIDVAGRVGVGTLGSAGLSTHLCLNGVNDIAYCSSSLRYKTNIQPFIPGLTLIKRLRPITFNWKEVGTPDMGLGAEDVAEVEPLLVTYNKQGQVEGVKYDRIGVVLVNAIKEQQTQIEVQEKKIETQQNEFAERKAAEKNLQSQIDNLTKIICSLKPDADGCKQLEK